jgi:hypothetical protein
MYGFREGVSTVTATHKLIETRFHAWNKNVLQVYFVI